MSEDSTLDEFIQSKKGKNSGSEWNESKLEDLLSELLTGGRPTGGGLDEGEYISIGGTQVNSEGYIDLHELVYIPEDYFEKVKETQLQKHDILVVKDGANTGDVAIAWESDDRIVTNEHLFTLRADASINSPYLFYFLLSHRGWKQINGTITGSAQEGINRGFTGKVDVQYPPLSEQRKIATVLYTVDRAIEKTEQIIDQIQKTKTGVMTDLFRGRAKDSPTESTRIGPIDVEKPKHWKVSSLENLTEDVVEIDHKMPEKIEEGVPFITAGDVTQRYNIDLESTDKISQEDYEKYSEKFDAQKEDILYTRYGTYIGVARKIDFDPKIIASWSIALIKPDEINPDYLSQFLNSRISRKEAEIRTRGSANRNLNLSEIVKLSIFVPPEEEQAEISHILSNFDDSLKFNTEYLSQLRKIKKALLQDLLSGTVRTTDTTIEVPEEIAQYG